MPLSLGGPAFFSFLGYDRGAPPGDFTAAHGTTRLLPNVNFVTLLRSDLPVVVI
jgi:hypothetical protein